MEVMLVLIIVSLLVAGGFLVAFLRNLNSGEFDDLTSPSVTMLKDEEKNSFQAE